MAKNALLSSIALRLGLPWHDPLVIDDFAKEHAAGVREAIIAWGASNHWRGRLDHQHPRGWKSPMGVLDLNNLDCARLRNKLYALLDEHIQSIAGPAMQAWAMVNWQGAEHARHTHASVKTSGIYYLDDGATPTLFDLPIDPRETSMHVVPVAPKAGRLVLFSGSLPHRVPKVITQTERVTIAFNVLY